MSNELTYAQADANALSAIGRMNAHKRAAIAEAKGQEKALRKLGAVAQSAPAAGRIVREKNQLAKMIQEGVATIRKLREASRKVAEKGEKVANLKHSYLYSAVPCNAYGEPLENADPFDITPNDGRAMWDVLAKCVRGEVMLSEQFDEINGRMTDGETGALEMMGEGEVLRIEKRHAENGKEWEKYIGCFKSEDGRLYFKVIAVSEREELGEGTFFLRPANADFNANTNVAETATA